MILNDLGKHPTRLTGKLRQQFPVFFITFAKNKLLWKCQDGLKKIVNYQLK